MKLHTVLVTAFGFGVLLACALPACAQSQEEEQIVQRIETSKGTCECVLYSSCSVEDTVDTTVFKIRNRGKRQTEEQAEQCNGGKVCCLVNRTPPTSDPPTPTPSPQRPKGQKKNPECICLPKDRCGNNDTAVFNGGAGMVMPRMPACEADEVVCCHESFVAGASTCKCLDAAVCGKNETAAYHGGANIIIRKNAHCTNPEVVCCSDSFVTGITQGTRNTHPPVPRTCGTRNNKLGFNINRNTTPGNNTVFGEYPWMLVILKSEATIGGSENAFVCGGSLIQPHVAITAAHCIDNLKKEDLKVRAGEWNSRDEDPSEVESFQEQRVAEVIIHPKYDNRTLYNDVAILKLENPFTLTDYVNIICLPYESFAKEPTRCTATGWGQTDFSLNSKYADVLKQVSLPLIPRDKCQEKFRRTKLGEYFIVDPSFICAGGEEGRDTCTGDGGGPLSCTVSGDERFYLIGITAWGIDCGKKDVPGAYANVTALSGWISQQLEESSSI